MNIENTEIESNLDLNVRPSPAPLNINSLPALPFEGFFRWFPLVDLLSAHSVCRQWEEAAVREVLTHRDSLALCIDGAAEEQKTSRYLERQIWNLPHKEVLLQSNGRPLYPDYVPPSRRSTWHQILLGTRQENPILLDGTPEATQAAQQWETDFDSSFEATLDEQVCRLLCLFSRGPRHLTIVCRSQHRDFLRLLPLLSAWKECLVTLNLYSSPYHKEINDTVQKDYDYRWVRFRDPLNGPLFELLNSMSSLRHLTLDFLGQEDDDVYGCSYVDTEFYPYPDLSFTFRLQSLTLADCETGTFSSHFALKEAIRKRAGHPLALQVGNRVQFSQLTGTYQMIGAQVLAPHLRHLYYYYYYISVLETQLGEVEDAPSPFTMLLSFALNLVSATTLPSSHHDGWTGAPARLMSRWFEQLRSLEERAVVLPPRPARLSVLTFTLVDEQPIDGRVPFFLSRIFPALQVIILNQRLLRPPADTPTQLEPYFTAIRGAFADTLCRRSADDDGQGAPAFSRLLLLEANLLIYRNLAYSMLTQREKHTWTVQQLKESPPGLHLLPSE